MHRHADAAKPQPSHMAKIIIMGTHPANSGINSFELFRSGVLGDDKVSVRPCGDPRRAIQQASEEFLCVVYNVYICPNH